MTIDLNADPRPELQRNLGGVIAALVESAYDRTSGKTHFMSFPEFAQVAIDRLSFSEMRPKYDHLIGEIAEICVAPEELV